jgi:hypothetical protein
MRTYARNATMSSVGKTPAEQADAVQVAKPLTVGDIALVSRDMLEVARLHEPDVETAPFIQTMAIDRQNLTNSVWPESSRRM